MCCKYNANALGPHRIVGIRKKSNVRVVLWSQIFPCCSVLGLDNLYLIKVMPGNSSALWELTKNIVVLWQSLSTDVEQAK